MGPMPAGGQMPNQPVFGSTSTPRGSARGTRPGSRPSAAVPSSESLAHWSKSPSHPGGITVPGSPRTSVHAPLPIPNSDHPPRPKARSSIPPAPPPHRAGCSCGRGGFHPGSSPEPEAVPPCSTRSGPRGGYRRHDLGSLGGLQRFRHDLPALPDQTARNPFAHRITSDGGLPVPCRPHTESNPQTPAVPGLRYSLGGP